MEKYVGVQSWKAAHLPTLEIRVEQKGNRVYKNILVSKKLRKNCHFFIDFSILFSYRNLPYQAWITHAKFHQRSSNGSGGIRGEAYLVNCSYGEGQRKNGCLVRVS